jgi:hypothetical protein
MTKCLRLSVVTAFVLSGLISGAAVAQTDFSKFPLIKVVPADAFITVAAKKNPERKFLDDYWAEVHKAFMASGILDDAWDMITEKVSDEQLDKIEELREQFSTLAAKVEWADLFGNEMIYAGRLSPAIANGSPYEGLLIGRLPSAKKAAANTESLKAILAEVAKLVEAESGDKAVGLGEVEIEGVKFTTFGPDVLPQVICLGCRDDLVILSIFNRSLLQEALGLLSGSSKTPRLIDSEKFKAAFKQLPPAEDKLVFWSTSSMFDSIGAMIRSATASNGDKPASPAKESDPPKAKKVQKKNKRSQGHRQAEATDEEEEGGKPEPATDRNGEEKSLQLIFRILKDLALIDYTATVEWTDGYQVFTETITALPPDAKSKPLYGIFAGGEPVEKFEKYIPEETTNFWRSSGINFLKTYRYVAGFIEETGPEGKQALADFTKLVSDELNLDLEKDILSLLDGNMMTAKIGEEWIIMIKVNDDKKASALISSLLGTINSKLGQQNALILSDVEIAGKKTFTQVSHPMMMMMGGLRPPVIGVAEGHIIVASAASTVTKCLETAAGKHPNITKNARWKKEALIPKGGPLDSISFTDETNKASELQALIGGISMATGMIGMFAQDMPPEMRSFISALTPILAKLGPVVGKMDFYQSSASYSTFDSKGWHKREVQTYKEPRPTSQSSEAEESSTAKVKAKKDAGEKKDASEKKESRRAKRARKEKAKETEGE